MLAKNAARRFGLVWLCLPLIAGGALIVASRAAHRVSPIPLPSGMDTSYYQVALSPDGQTLAVAKVEGAAELWTMPTGKRQVLPNPIGLRSGLWEVAYSTNGRLLAAARPEGITIWEVPAAKVTAQVSVERIGGMEFIDGDRTLVALAIPKDYKPTPEGDNPEIIRVDVGTGKLTRTGDLGLNSVTQQIAPGGRFAAIEIGQAWWIYDVAARARVTEVGGGDDLVFKAAFSGDGSTLVWCGRRGLSVLEVPSGKELRHFEMIPPFDAGQTPCFSVSLDGKLLAAGRYPSVNSASIVSLETGKLLGTVECGPESAICSRVLLSLNGSTLATTTYGVDVRDQPIPSQFRLWRINQAQ